LIATCIRIMYLGIMGWIGSLLTIRGVTIIAHAPKIPKSAPTKRLPAKPIPQKRDIKRPKEEETKPQKPKTEEPREEEKPKAEPKPPEPEIIVMPPEEASQPPPQPRSQAPQEPPSY